MALIFMLGYLLAPTSMPCDRSRDSVRGRLLVVRRERSGCNGSAKQAPKVFEDLARTLRSTFDQRLWLHFEASSTTFIWSVEFLSVLSKGRFSSGKGRSHGVLRAQGHTLITWKCKGPKWLREDFRHKLKR